MTSTFFNSPHSGSGQGIDQEGQLLFHVSCGAAAMCPWIISAGSASIFHIALSSIRICKSVPPYGITVIGDGSLSLTVFTLPLDKRPPWRSQLLVLYDYELSLRVPLSKSNTHLCFFRMRSCATPWQIILASNIVLLCAVNHVTLRPPTVKAHGAIT